MTKDVTCLTSPNSDMSVLMLANDIAKTLELLFLPEININHCDNHGDTFLVEICRASDDQVMIVKRMIAMGANIDAISHQQFTSSN